MAHLLQTPPPRQKRRSAARVARCFPVPQHSAASWHLFSCTLGLLCSQGTRQMCSNVSLIPGAPAFTLPRPCDAIGLRTGFFRSAAPARPVVESYLCACALGKAGPRSLGPVADSASLRVRRDKTEAMSGSSPWAAARFLFRSPGPCAVVERRRLRIDFVGPPRAGNERADHLAPPSPTT